LTFRTGQKQINRRGRSAGEPQPKHKLSWSAAAGVPIVRRFCAQWGGGALGCDGRIFASGQGFEW